MKKTNKGTKRINLTFEDDFYNFLKTKSEEDFIKLGTWVKQFLKQNLMKNNGINKIDNHEQKI
jgi:hypothetical protein